MFNFNRSAERLFRLLCSLKLAVVVIVSIGVISAVGTIVESKYDMLTAQKLVYHSPYMYTVMVLLIINLIAVAVDRLPWQKKHIGFVMAHAGIITLLLGSYVTRKIGIDGSLTFDIGETTQFVSTTETELLIYKLKDMESSEKIFSQDVDFLVKNPKKKPIHIAVDGTEIRVDDFMPYARKDFKVIESDKITDGPALRFQIQNEFVNVTEWIVQVGTQPAKLSLGPAQVVLARDNYLTLGGQNEIVVYPGKTPKTLRYEIYDKSGKKQKSGDFEINKDLNTGWMGLKFKALQFYPKGRVEYQYSKLERPNPKSTAAVQLEFQSKKYWLGLNTALQLFTNDAVYFVVYGNKRLDLGFNMTLDKFEVERYQGSQQAKSYKSLVNIPGLGQKEISMNEPLKHNGFTFYQSSFQEDRMGNPIASVLSVNYDPGRWIKYLGSLGIVFGSIILFYFRKWGVKK